MTSTMHSVLRPLPLRIEAADLPGSVTFTCVNYTVTVMRYLSPDANYSLQFVVFATKPQTERGRGTFLGSYSP